MNKRPKGLNGHLILRLYTDLLSEGLILAYQQVRPRINKKSTMIMES